MEVHTLIVDDDPILHFIMKKMMEIINWAYPVVSFENGLLALNYIKDNHQRESAFIIFLDINMPVMDGWAFLEAIKEFASPSNTIVYVVSSSRDDSDIAEALRCDFVADYISKPLYTEKLNSLKEAVMAKLLSNDF